MDSKIALKQLEIQESIKRQGGSSMPIESFMQDRLESIKTPDLSQIKAWQVQEKSIGSSKPCFIETDSEGKPTLYETEIPRHRVITNLPITDLDEISISTPTFHGEEEEFAGYGITPGNPNHRMQREKMPKGKIGGIIAVEQEDMSLSLGIRVPARGIKPSLPNEPLVYGHPDHDGFSIRPFTLTANEGIENKAWDGRKGFATVVADGNTSRQMGAVSLKINPGIIITDLEDSTFQVLGQPEPFTHLALQHVAEVAQLIDPRNETYNLAARVQQVQTEQQAGNIPITKGGTTATLSMQIMPCEGSAQTLYRNQNFQPEARPGKTNLGKSFFITSDGKIVETTLGTVTIQDAITGKVENVLINDGGASKSFLLPNWWEFLKTHEIFEANPVGIRVETTDGILSIKDPKRLIELVTKTSAEKLADILANEETLNSIFELHAYDDATMVITVAGEIRNNIRPERIQLHRVLSQLLRQAIPKVQVDEKAIEEKLLLENNIEKHRQTLEQLVKMRATDGSISKTALSLEALLIEAETKQRKIETVGKVRSLLERGRGNLLMLYAATVDSRTGIIDLQTSGGNVLESLEVVNLLISKEKNPKNFPQNLNQETLHNVFTLLISNGLIRINEKVRIEQFFNLLTQINKRNGFKKVQEAIGDRAGVPIKELIIYFSTGKSPIIEQWNSEVEAAKSILEEYLTK